MQFKNQKMTLPAFAVKTILNATILPALALCWLYAPLAASAAPPEEEEGEIILPAPAMTGSAGHYETGRYDAGHPENETLRHFPQKTSPAPHYPSDMRSPKGQILPEAGKIKGYVSDVSHSRGMVAKQANGQESEKFAPQITPEMLNALETMPPEAMNDASDKMVKEALSGAVPEVSAPPPRPLNRSNPELEKKFRLWFSLTPGQKELRDYIYPLIPKVLSACPTWDSQLSGWTSCQNAIPEQVKFRQKLTQESVETQIQQWFFLNEMADIGASEDDMLRAQTFIARYFSEMVEDQLQKKGWCYGPSWVSAAEQSWMSCRKMPLRSSRTDAGWGQYRRPHNAPKPLWPMPG